MTKVRRFSNVPEKNVEQLVADLRSECSKAETIRVTRQPNGLFQVEVVSEDPTIQASRTYPNADAP